MFLFLFVWTLSAAVQASSELALISVWNEVLFPKAALTGSSWTDQDSVLSSEYFSVLREFVGKSENMHIITEDSAEYMGFVRDIYLYEYPEIFDQAKIISDRSVTQGLEDFFRGLPHETEIVVGVFSDKTQSRKFLEICASIPALRCVAVQLQFSETAQGLLQQLRLVNMHVDAWVSGVLQTESRQVTWTYVHGTFVFSRFGSSSSPSSSRPLSPVEAEMPLFGVVPKEAVVVIIDAAGVLVPCDGSLDNAKALDEAAEKMISVLEEYGKVIVVSSESGTVRFRGGKLLVNRRGEFEGLHEMMQGEMVVVISSNAELINQVHRVVDIGVKLTVQMARCGRVRTQIAMIDRFVREIKLWIKTTRDKAYKYDLSSGRFVLIV